MEVWKYELEIKDRQLINMPAKAKILTLETIQYKPILFALVNPMANKLDRVVRVYETGDLVKGGKYVGTHQAREGIFVYHIFDEGEAE